MSYISAMMDRKNDAVIVWERDKDGTRIEQVYDAPYYFYVDDPDGRYTTIYDTKVSKLVFKGGREFYGTRKNLHEEGEIRMWESDIPPTIRVLSNHYYGVPAPKINVTFLDIEVDYCPELVDYNEKVKIRRKKKPSV